jgi:hypothetical protein
MTPPVVAPANLPLPLAVAGGPAVSQRTSLNTGLLLQYRVAFNQKLPSCRRKWNTPRPHAHLARQMHPSPSGFPKRARSIT